jgi:hypothetical protein
MEVTVAPDKEGWMWKRTGRIARWHQRYFMLTGHRIAYKYKPDGPLRGTFDLTRGCVVREVVEEMRAGKKIYCFWIIWPELDAAVLTEATKGELTVGQTKNRSNSMGMHDRIKEESPASGGESDRESGTRLPPPDYSTAISSSSSSSAPPPPAAPVTSAPIEIVAGTDSSDATKSGRAERKSRDGTGTGTSTGSGTLSDRDFKKIVESEAKSQRTQAKFVEHELEKHETQDNNLSMGVKVAAVAVGGVVVGALTAGIGIVPYITVVGLTAVASGGAVALQYRRPSDSRFVLACETMADAMEWKNIVELQISRLERSARGIVVPSVLESFAMQNMMGGQIDGKYRWERTSVHESMCILERQELKAVGQAAAEDQMDVMCKKAQTFFHNTPVSIFLCLMTIPCPVRTCWRLANAKCESEIVQVLDDHCDVLLTTMHIPSSSMNKPITLLLTRFWKLDDDGTYLITYNTVDVKKVRAQAGEGADLDALGGITVTPGLGFDAVFTVSPRRDHMEYEQDLQQALVTCTAQISFPSSSEMLSGFGSRANVRLFLDEYLKQLTDFRDHLSRSKFCCCAERKAAGGEVSIGRSATFASRSSMSSMYGTYDSSSSHDVSLLAALDGLDGRSGLGLLDATDANGLPMQPHTASSSSSMRRPSRHRRFRGRENAEASSLRGTIAAKEYEIQRLENDMHRKKREGQQRVGSETAVRLQTELEELSMLKSKYEKVAGTEYYHNLGSRCDLGDIAAEAAQENSRGSPIGKPSTQPTHMRRSSKIPSFWTSSNRHEDVIIQRHGSGMSIGSLSLHDRGSAWRKNKTLLVTLVFTCGISFVLFIAELVT